MKTKLMLAAAVLAVFAPPTRAEMSGLPPEIQFWLVQPTIPVAEASVRQLGMTTGEALPAAEAKVKQPSMTTGEGPDVPYPRARPNENMDELGITRGVPYPRARPK
jgi:hypothetical protein